MKPKRRDSLLQKKNAKRRVNVHFTMLCQLFPNYIWQEYTLEILGISEDGKTFVCIDDGLCCKSKYRGWLVHQWKLTNPHPNCLPIYVWEHYLDDIDSDNKILEKWMDLSFD